MIEAVQCKICNQPSIFFARAAILNRYKIAYYRCEQCGFIQTEEPFWLEEAYSEALSDNDVGVMSRNLITAKITSVVIKLFFNQKAQFIDYGGGYGLFVRMLRDLGYDFFWYDRYASNLFARGFEADLSKGYELLSAFEVFEHFAHPQDELKKMLALSQNLLFTTTLVPPNTPQPDDWYYYELEHGQHVSLWTKKSISYLAERYGLNFYTDNRYLHLITEKKLSNVMVKVLFRQKVIEALSLVAKSKSLRDSDYLRMTGRSLQSSK
jgi:hypothetical protein